MSMKNLKRKCVLLISSILIVANSFNIFAEILPNDVQTFFEQGKYYVVKTFTLSKQQNESEIVGKSFEQNGIIYNQSDIEITPIIEEEKKEVKQAESVSVSSQNVNLVLSKLPQQKEYTDEEGFAGIIYPASDEISFSANGYNTKTYTANDFRYYFNLPSKDTSNIAKSITSQGISMSLTNIQWIDSNNADSGDTAVGNNYTAKVSYSGTYTKKIPNGYTAIVPYKGEVYREVTHQKQYKITYIGEEINLEVPENPQSVSKIEVYMKGIIISGAVFGISLGLIIVYCLIKKWKSKKMEE